MHGCAPHTFVEPSLSRSPRHPSCDPAARRSIRHSGLLGLLRQPSPRHVSARITQPLHSQQTLPLLTARLVTDNHLTRRFARLPTPRWGVGRRLITGRLMALPCTRQRYRHRTGTLRGRRAACAAACDGPAHSFRWPDSSESDQITRFPRHAKKPAVQRPNHRATWQGAFGCGSPTPSRSGLGASGLLAFRMCR
jgi:hypothetical protein